MSLIEFELEEVRKICENVIEDSRLHACVESLVRLDINQTKRRALTICLRFPTEYPKQPLLIELKSKTLGEKVLVAITTTLETYCKQELLGKPQILPLLRYLAKYLIDNPLCIVYDEIMELRALISASPDDGSELKLRQSRALIKANIRGGRYFFRADVSVPENYPDSCILWSDFDTNLPPVLQRYINGQAREHARQCVEPPIHPKPGAPPFEPRPSLFRTLSFIIEALRGFPRELCPVCMERCLPEEPEKCPTVDTDEMFVERAYCGHIYHAKCLRKYFREPPFTDGGKLCAAGAKHARPDALDPAKERKDKRKPVTGCGQRLLHDKWALDVKRAEQRWAHKKARERELEEVMDFLQ